MINPEHLMLKVPPEDLQLIRRLLVEVKGSLGTVEYHERSNGEGSWTSVNSKYLNAIALDRSTLASSTLLRALPESLHGQKAYIYLSHSEFQTILTLLEEKSASVDEVGSKCHALWGQLTLRNFTLRGDTKSSLTNMRNYGGIQ